MDGDLAEFIRSRKDWLRVGVLTDGDRYDVVLRIDGTYDANYFPPEQMARSWHRTLMDALKQEEASDGR